MPYTIQYRVYGSGPLASEAKQTLIGLFRDTGLYATIEIEQDLLTACLELLFISGLKFDNWCIGCAKDSTFTLNPLLSSEVRAALHQRRKLQNDHELDYREVDEKLQWLTFSCARDATHQVNFVCRLDTIFNMEAMKVSHYDLSKIGQDPSPAEIEKQHIRKYSGTLKEPDFSEFGRAIGLASHDIGIGSFVYLRRIFERLVNETAREVESDLQRQSEIINLPMSEKIQALSGHLPKFLVDNAVLYKILSLGIHELEEEQCLSAFEPVKVGIELILDEKIEKKEKERKIEVASKSIADLSSKLGPRKNH